jgi:hypothetical protein
MKFITYVTLLKLYFDSIGISTVLTRPKAESGVNQKVKHLSFTINVGRSNQY